jgi:hypothetical protein
MWNQQEIMKNGALASLKETRTGMHYVLVSIVYVLVSIVYALSSVT